MLTGFYTSPVANRGKLALTNRPPPTIVTVTCARFLFIRFIWCLRLRHPVVGCGGGRGGPGLRLGLGGFILLVRRYLDPKQLIEFFGQISWLIPEWAWPWWLVFGYWTGLVILFYKNNQKIEVDEK